MLLGGGPTVPCNKADHRRTYMCQGLKVFSTHVNYNHSTISVVTRIVLVTSNDPVDRLNKLGCN